MKRFLCSIAAVAMALCGSAAAEQRLELHGLFCKTEGQIEQTLTHMRRNLPPWLAVEIINEREIACVFADRIYYVITNPAMIGEARIRGIVLMKYEATLVGVLVAGNLRDIEPPMQIYFLSGERLPGAPVLKNT